MSASNTKYKYVELKTLKAHSKVDVYGVVKFFKPPYKSRGSDHCMMVSIIDRSYSDTHMEKLKCLLFNRDVKNLPPVKLGQIIRFHRLSITEFNGSLQGQNGPGFSWVLFSGEPGTSLEPLKASSTNYRITDADKNKVDELRQWASGNNELRDKLIRFNDVATGCYFDLICQVVYTSVIEDGVTRLFKVWDGTNCIYPCREVSSESQDSNVQKDETLLKTAQGFIHEICVFDDHFVPSGSIKPGDYVKFSNLHATEYKPGSKDNGQSTIELVVHRGNAFGRGVCVVESDGTELYELKQRLEVIALQNESYDISEVNSQELGPQAGPSSVSGSHVGPSSVSGPHAGLSAMSGPNAGPLSRSEPQAGPSSVAVQSTGVTVEASNIDTRHPVPFTSGIISKQTCNTAGKPSDILDKQADKTIKNTVSSSLDIVAIQLCNVTRTPSPLSTGISVAAEQSSGNPASSVTQAPALQNTEPVTRNSPNKSSRIIDSNQPSCRVHPYNNRAGEQNLQSGNNARQEAGKSAVVSAVNDELRDGRKHQATHADGVHAVQISESNVASSLPRCMVQTSTVVLNHPHVERSKILEVLDHNVPYKFCVRAKILDYHPKLSDVRSFLKLYCSTCQYLCSHPGVDCNENNSERLRIGSTFHGVPHFNCPRCFENKDSLEALYSPPHLKYIYMMRFILGDDTGTLMANLWMHDAVTFFQDLEPEYLLNNKSGIEQIGECLTKICPDKTLVDGKPWIECCIKSYCVAEGTGYQMFDTCVV